MQTHRELCVRWRRVVAAAAAAWLSVALMLPAQTASKKYAVLVGVNQYEHARSGAQSSG